MCLQLKCTSHVPTSLLLVYTVTTLKQDLFGLSLISLDIKKVRMSVEFLKPAHLYWILMFKNMYVLTYFLLKKPQLVKPQTYCLKARIKYLKKLVFCQMIKVPALFIILIRSFHNV